MVNHHPEWDELGRSIQQIVDCAVNARDFQRLNQTIRQTVEKALDLGTEAVRKASVPKAAQTEARQGEVLTRQQVQNLYGNTGGRTAGGVLKIVGGGVLCFLTLVVASAAATMEFMFGIPVGAAGAWVAAACLGAGGVLIGSGIGGLNRVGRFKKYRRMLGDKTHCTIEKLARGVGKSAKFVKKELLKMIDQGLFLEGHLDHEQRHLITSDETFRHYEQSRLQLEQRQKQAAEELAAKAQQTQDSRAQEVLDRGNAFIAEIRRCNDAIPGEDISAKIYHMEMIVQRIFLRAKTNPEVIPDLKKLMDYYLPMTVKLLNAYADMDAQPVQGENILASKKEIEGTLDTLNAAFEKLLDELFADTAMDISSDISVLQTLLAQEGLTGDGLTQMKQ